MLLNSRVTQSKVWALGVEARRMAAQTLELRA